MLNILLAHYRRATVSKPNTHLTKSSSVRLPVSKSFYERLAIERGNRPGVGVEYAFFGVVELGYSDIYEFSFRDWVGYYGLVEHKI